MARSFYRPSAAKVVEDYERNNRFFHAPSGRHYRMVRRNGRFFQQRYQLQQGREVNLFEQEVRGDRDQARHETLPRRGLRQHEGARRGELLRGAALSQRFVANARVLETEWAAAFHAAGCQIELSGHPYSAKAPHVCGLEVWAASSWARRRAAAADRCSANRCV